MVCLCSLWLRHILPALILFGAGMILCVCLFALDAVLAVVVTIWGKVILHSLLEMNFTVHQHLVNLQKNKFLNLFPSS